MERGKLALFATSSFDKGKQDDRLAVLTAEESRLSSDFNKKPGESRVGLLPPSVRESKDQLTFRAETHEVTSFDSNTFRLPLRAQRNETTRNIQLHDRVPLSVSALVDSFVYKPDNMAVYVQATIKHVRRAMPHSALQAPLFSLQVEGSAGSWGDVLPHSSVPELQSEWNGDWRPVGRPGWLRSALQTTTRQPFMPPVGEIIAVFRGGCQIVCLVAEVQMETATCTLAYPVLVEDVLSWESLPVRVHTESEACWLPLDALHRMGTEGSERTCIGVVMGKTVHSRKSGFLVCYSPGTFIAVRAPADSPTQLQLRVVQEHVGPTIATSPVTQPSSRMPPSLSGILCTSASGLPESLNESTIISCCESWPQLCEGLPAGRRVADIISGWPQLAALPRAIPGLPAFYPGEVVIARLFGLADFGPYSVFVGHVIDVVPWAEVGVVWGTGKPAVGRSNEVDGPVAVVITDGNSTVAVPILETRLFAVRNERGEVYPEPPPHVNKRTLRTDILPRGLVLDVRAWLCHRGTIPQANETVPCYMAEDAAFPSSFVPGVAMPGKKALPYLQDVIKANASADKWTATVVQHTNDLLFVQAAPNLLPLMTGMLEYNVERTAAELFALAGAARAGPGASAGGASPKKAGNKSNSSSSNSRFTHAWLAKRQSAMQTALRDAGSSTTGLATSGAGSAGGTTDAPIHYERLAKAFIIACDGPVGALEALATFHGSNEAPGSPFPFVSDMPAEQCQVLEAAVLLTPCPVLLGAPIPSAQKAVPARQRGKATTIDSSTPASDSASPELLLLPPALLLPAFPPTNIPVEVLLTRGQGGRSPLAAMLHAAVAAGDAQAAAWVHSIIKDRQDSWVLTEDGTTPLHVLADTLGDAHLVLPGGATAATTRTTSGAGAVRKSAHVLAALTAVCGSDAAQTLLQGNVPSPSSSQGPLLAAFGESTDAAPALLRYARTWLRLAHSRAAPRAETKSSFEAGLDLLLRLHAFACGSPSALGATHAAASTDTQDTGPLQALLQAVCETLCSPFLQAKSKAELQPTVGEVDLDFMAGCVVRRIRASDPAFPESFQVRIGDKYATLAEVAVNTTMLAVMRGAMLMPASTPAPDQYIGEALPFVSEALPQAFVAELIGMLKAADDADSGKPNSGMGPLNRWFISRQWGSNPRSRSSNQSPFLEQSVFRLLFGTAHNCLRVACAGWQNQNRPRHLYGLQAVLGVASLELLGGPEPLFRGYRAFVGDASDKLAIGTMIIALNLPWRDPECGRWLMNHGLRHYASAGVKEAMFAGLHGGAMRDCGISVDTVGRWLNECALPTASGATGWWHRYVACVPFLSEHSSSVKSLGEAIAKDNACAVKLFAGSHTALFPRAVIRLVCDVPGPQPEPALVGLCDRCSKDDASLICGKCKIRRYCDRECQTADWPYHELTCQDAKKLEGLRDAWPLSEGADLFAEDAELLEACKLVASAPQSTAREVIGPLVPFFGRLYGGTLGALRMLCHVVANVPSCGRNTASFLAVGVSDLLCDTAFNQAFVSGGLPLASKP